MMMNSISLRRAWLTWRWDLMAAAAWVAFAVAAWVALSHWEVIVRG